MAIGIGLGTAIGVATDNLGLWIGVGTAIGVSIGSAWQAKAEKKES